MWLGRGVPALIAVALAGARWSIEGDTKSFALWDPETHASLAHGQCAIDGMLSDQRDHFSMLLQYAYIRYLSSLHHWC
jgi:hypothetical protein